VSGGLGVAFGGQPVDFVAARGREVDADGAEGLGPGRGPHASRHLDAELGHPNRPNQAPLPEQLPLEFRRSRLKMTTTPRLVPANMVTAVRPAEPAPTMITSCMQAGTGTFREQAAQYGTIGLAGIPNGEGWQGQYALRDHVIGQPFPQTVANLCRR
jgi:hypothetical protein